MTLDPGSTGRRVVVRYTTGGRGPSGGPEMTDVVGRVLSSDADSVTLERRDGTTVLVDRALIVTWKPVPDQPLRRRRAADASVDDLAGITAQGWPAVVSQPLGEWELRASAGFTKRANSVSVHGAPDRSFVESLLAVHAFYSAQGLRPMVQVVTGSTWERQFAEAGWHPMADRGGEAIVQVADLSGGHAADPDAVVAPTASDEWLSGYGRVDDPNSARAVLEAPPTVGFVAVGSPVLAVGRVTVSGEWAGLSCVEVAPTARRQGLGRRVVETALAWAESHGADKCYVQVTPDNEAALGLYRSLGFVDHHGYRYLVSG